MIFLSLVIIERSRSMEQSWTPFHNNQNFSGREFSQACDYAQTQSGNYNLPHLSYQSSSDYQANSDFSQNKEGIKPCNGVTPTPNEESFEQFFKPNITQCDQKNDNSFAETSFNNNNKIFSVNENGVYFNLNSSYNPSSNSHEPFNNSKSSGNSNECAITGQSQTYNSNEPHAAHCDSNYGGGINNFDTHFHDEFNSSAINSAMNSDANKYRTCVNNNHIRGSYQFPSPEGLSSYDPAPDVTSTTEAFHNGPGGDAQGKHNRSEANVDTLVNSSSYFQNQHKYEGSSETANLVGSFDINVINKENSDGIDEENFNKNSNCGDNNYANANFTTTFCHKTYETSKAAHEVLIKNHNPTSHVTSRDRTSNNDKHDGGGINPASEHHRQLQDNNKFYASSNSMFYSNATYQYEGINNSNSFAPSPNNGDINGTPSNINQNGTNESHISTNFIGERQISPLDFNSTCNGNEINGGAASSYGNFYSNFAENNQSNSNKLRSKGLLKAGEGQNGIMETAAVRRQNYTSHEGSYSSISQSDQAGARKDFNDAVHFKSKHFPTITVNGDHRASNLPSNYMQSLTANKRAPLRGSSYSPLYHASPRPQHNTPRYPHQLYHSYPDHRYQNGHTSGVGKAVSSSSGKSSARSSVSQTSRSSGGHQTASAAAVAATVSNINALLSSSTSGPALEQKPVECNLCHRKFKNIPALNGHMRLHGGYFKKESEAKKNDKKDSSSGASTAPLQTASMSVRALIEEKIIQKRSSNPAHTQTNLSYSNAALQTSTSSTFSETTSSVSLSENSSDSLKLSSFIVPATPHCSEEKNTQRRHSDSEHFVSPRTPPIATSPSSDTQILSDILHKKNTKPGVKRASSDPGSHTGQNCDVNLSFNDTLTSYTGVLGVYHGDDGYFSPSLQDEMFNHVQAIQDSLLLQGVDAAQLAESIQAATLQEIASLEEYSNSDPNNHYQQDLQSVLNSPLPVSIADFAYQAQNQSFTQETTFTQSPLPSPSFTYPTPPASQEGQSPSFGNLQSVISHPSSSPLSASFCMSSSAAVEAALNEVLPMEQHNIYPSPPPQSPLSGTPEPSPLSLPPSAVSSPLPHQMLQSQMMPNSDDPLLSSSPKDFASRKKFDFHTFKILNNGSLDYLNGNQQGITGIVLDRNGELKLIQNGFQHGKSNGLLNGITTVYVKQEPQSMQQADVKPVLTSIAMGNKTYLGPSRNVPQIKEEVEDEVFANPISVSDQSSKYASSNGYVGCSNSRKRRLDTPSRGGFPPHPAYQSRLRAVRTRTSASPPLHYSAPPLLSPSRGGSGLYWQALTSWPSSTTFKDENMSAAEMRYLESRDMAPECDAAPHVNVGPQYQALIPECCPYGARTEREPTYEHLLWDPGISKVTSVSEVDMYLEFACCAAVPGGGRNKEYALHLLHLCNGNIHSAMLRLMQPTPTLQPGHPLLSMEYTDNERWNVTEIEIFQQSLLKYDKDLSCVAQEIGSKSLKQCIQFYYLWKKVCPDEYKRIRLSRRRNRDFDFDFKSDIPVTDVDLVSTSSESRLFVCEYPDCSASFNSRAALNGHIKIHGGATSLTLERRATPTPTPTPPSLSVSSADLLEEFPCKICGKVFNKVKSRSAHMKSHRPLDAEPKHLKVKLSSSPVLILDTVDTAVGRAMGITSTYLQSHMRPN